MRQWKYGALLVLVSGAALIVGVKYSDDVKAHLAEVKKQVDTTTADYWASPEGKARLDAAATEGKLV